MLIIFGGTTEQPIMGWLVDATWNGKMENGIRLYSAENYTYAFTIAPISLLIASCLAVLLIIVRPRYR